MSRIPEAIFRLLIYGGISDWNWEIATHLQTIQSWYRCDESALVQHNQSDRNKLAKGDLGNYTVLSYCKVPTVIQGGNIGLW